MAPSQQRCTGKLPTQTATSTSSPSIHMAHKHAVVKTLHSRAEAICSDVTAKDLETWRIRQAFINNWYLRGVLHHHACYTGSTKTHAQMTRPGAQLSPSLMYVCGLSEAVR